MSEYQISIEGKVSQPEVKEIIKKYEMSSFKNGQGYTGYYANVTEERAEEFADWWNREQPASTWIEANKIWR
jgi:hypothetical protein